MSVKTPAVVEGKLLRASPSSIESHTRCPRRWWFKEVQGLSEGPDSPAIIIGNEGHARIEHYLKTGLDVLSDIERPAKIQGFIPDPSPDLEIETWGRAYADMLPVVMRLDLQHVRDGKFVVTDWKFKSNLRYAKDEHELRGDIQMGAYAMQALIKHPELTSVMVEHVNMQYRGGAKATRVQVEMYREDAEAVWEKVIAACGEMSATAAITEEKEVPTCSDPGTKESNCYAFHQECPFAAQCSAHPKGSMLMSLFDKIKARNGAIPPSGFPQTPVALPPPAVHVPVPVIPSVDPLPQYAAVLPPDAPKSAPVAPYRPPAPPAEASFSSMATLAVPPDVRDSLRGAVEAAEEAMGLREPAPVKRGRGRPPGSRNKNAPPSAPIVEEASPALKAATERAQGMMDRIAASTPVTPPIHADNASEGLVLFIDCRPDNGLCAPLDTYIHGQCITLAEASGVKDIRAVPKDNVLAFGAWKGYLAVLCKEDPPKGRFFVSSQTEINQVVIEALASHSGTLEVVRGTR